jgi:serine protease Do
MSATSTQQVRRLSPRRLVLLATTALGLSTGAILVAPSVVPTFSSAYAQTMARPVGFADIVERVKPAVISVRVRMETRQQAIPNLDEFPPGSEMDQFLRRYFDREGRDGNTPRMPRGRSYTTGQGSGFFISPDGYAVTNNHVVDKATQVQVTTDDGKTHTAKVIGVDQRTDLALIKVDGGNFPYVKLSERAPRVGDWVIAVGNPFGLGGTVTAGIVSARGRDIGSGPYDDYIQIDAPVNKGNSGGPTFDVDGNVIGVNTAIYSPSGGSVGIAFAIPADTVKTVVAQLKDKGSVLRGWIGVQVQAITPEIAQERGLKRTDGALVVEPSANGPAAKAGIRSGDVILSVNGNPVKDSRDLAKRIGNMSPGTTVRLAVLSGNEERTVSLQLGELPPLQQTRAEQSEPGPGPGPGFGRRFRDNDQNDDDSPRADRFRDRGNDGPRADRFGDRGGFAERFAQRGGDVPRLGLTFSPGDNPEGAVIASVEPNSRAAQIGFQAGDVIVEVGGLAVTSPRDVRRALRQARDDGKNSVTVKVKSRQGVRSLDIPLSRA